MNKQMLINGESTKGHTCFFYENEHARLKLIAEYLKQGIANNELCVFVTSGSVSLVTGALKKISPETARAIKVDAIHIFEMNNVYRPDDRFEPDTMLQNVKEFIQDAKDRGFRGLRTAGDMQWLQEFPDDLEKATAYEYTINTLTDTNPNFTGLCLYPVKDTAGHVTAAALQSHPTVIHENKVNDNPFYTPIPA